MTAADESLPVIITSENLWGKFANQYHAATSNIYTIKDYSSASKIGAKQYLALRALWNIARPEDYVPEAWGINKIKMAEARLNDVAHWKEFLKRMREDERHPPDELLPVPPLGGFSSVWYYQQLVMKSKLSIDDVEIVHGSPTRSKSIDADANVTEIFGELTVSDCEAYGLEAGDEEASELPDNTELDPDYKEPDLKNLFPPVSDENVVNTSLVGFASAVSYSVPGVQAHWSQERKGFKVGGKKKLYEARTDGHMFITRSSRSEVIIEVKPKRRDDSATVRMQETAEIAAWIYAERDDKPKKESKYRRMLLAQDRDEIYLVMAEYNANYIEYLTDPESTSNCNPFLTMNEFGPWDISSAKNVAQIAVIILAVTLQLGNGEPLI
ncbi:hypothetical protein FQN50_005617 [Emmonsiellopsis sp. PD_5]|nr:hypothetical protein FQN50_005617 [Emmonsiellopsis sp. PD_5]